CQIDDQLKLHNINSRFHHNIRISEAETMPLILQAISQVRHTIDARLSMGLPNTPMSGSDISVISGNFVTGMPQGIIDGVDMQYSGKVRSINASAINQLLDNHIVLLSNIGYSKSGETFNLPAEELATEVAISLQAEKLIFFNDEFIKNPLTDQFSTTECTTFLQQENVSSQLSSLLKHAIQAVKQQVKRVHIIDQSLDGGLLQELFTRDGAGMMITNLFYEGLRKATIDDIGGILELIQPLESSGVLIKRSREQLELEINFFHVIEKDGMTIACIACIPDPQTGMAEVACVAVHPDYRKSGFGDQMLAAIELEAKKAELKYLFILTTRTSHWFMEKGFSESNIDFLPASKQKTYNLDRQSRIMVKEI
ncbi:MAG: amino-acid N-acetyltransferase, partial [Gammaproteobacteria bacterium]|nr:amino-acid N-acetyltransferase [Gammaproteobacteria bacterium]